MPRRRALLGRRGSSASAGDLLGEPRVVSSGGEGDEEAAATETEERLGTMLPELLGEIVRRVETSEERWPTRRSVVACACVCRRWREVAACVVRPPIESGTITFLASLNKPGPRDAPI